MPKLLLIGSDQPHTLESSYGRAFGELGWTTHFWDPIAALHQTAPAGKLGRLISNFIMVEPWVRRANRQMVLKVQELRPDLVLTFTHTQIQPGALAQIKIVSDAKIVNIWPDTMVNWGERHAANLCFYDLIATYSSTSVPIFKRLGAKNVIWVPLAGDPFLHSRNSGLKKSEVKQSDVSFVGGWRPEREEVLSTLGGVDLKIWGPDWGRHCKNNSVIMKAWQGKPMYGEQFATVVANSKINLNIIDPTNYPAANMRFFELATIGGCQISSVCPEMDEIFENNKHIFYYQDHTQLATIIDELLDDEECRRRVALAGHSLCLAEHTYTHRAVTVLHSSIPDLLPPHFN